MIEHLREIKIIAWTTLIFGILLHVADKNRFDKKISTNLNLKNEVIDVDKLLIELGLLTKIDGLGRRESVRKLAKKYNRRSNEIYKLIEESKK